MGEGPDRRRNKQTEMEEAESEEQEKRDEEWEGEIEREREKEQRGKIQEEMEEEENWRQYEILGAVEGQDRRRNKQEEKEETEREEKEQSDGEWEREIEKEREEEQKGKRQEEMEEEKEWRQLEEQTGEIRRNWEKGKMNIESKGELEQKPAAVTVDKKGNKESKGEKRKIITGKANENKSRAQENKETREKAGFKKSREETGAEETIRHEWIKGGKVYRNEIEMGALRNRIKLLATWARVNQRLDVKRKLREENKEETEGQNKRMTIEFKTRCTKCETDMEIGKEGIRDNQKKGKWIHLECWSEREKEEEIKNTIRSRKEAEGRVLREKGGKAEKAYKEAKTNSNKRKEREEGEEATEEETRKKKRGKNKIWARNGLALQGWMEKGRLPRTGIG